MWRFRWTRATPTRGGWITMNGAMTECPPGVAPEINSRLAHGCVHRELPHYMQRAFFVRAADRKKAPKRSTREAPASMERCRFQIALQYWRSVADGRLPSTPFLRGDRRPDIGLAARPPESRIRPVPVQIQSFGPGLRPFRRGSSQISGWSPSLRNPRRYC